MGWNPDGPEGLFEFVTRKAYSTGFEDHRNRAKEPGTLSTATPAPYQRVDRDESYDRSYIPMPGGWEIQTKGKGSSFRICDPNGDRLNIPPSPYLYETLTQMALAVNAAWKAADFKPEIADVRTDA